MLEGTRSSDAEWPPSRMEDHGPVLTTAPWCRHRAQPPNEAIPEAPLMAHERLTASRGALQASIQVYLQQAFSSSRLQAWAQSCRPGGCCHRPCLRRNRS